MAKYLSIVILFNLISTHLFAQEDLDYQSYVRKIEAKYLYGISDSQKRAYLAIAAYNGGIGRVIKRVLKKYDVRQMSPSEVYNALIQEMPDETKDYLTSVRRKNCGVTGETRHVLALERWGVGVLECWSTY